MRPLYRRIIITGFTAGWAVLELSLGNPIWALFFGALALYIFYEYFIIYDEANYRDKDV